MDFIQWNASLEEVALSLNYIVVIFLLQIGAFFLKQWNEDRKKQIKNVPILSYAVYFIFFAIGSGIYFFISTHTTPDFDFYFLLSILLKGTGIVIFTFVIEHTLFKKTHFILTITLIGSLLLLTIFYGTPIVKTPFNILKLLTLFIPVFYLIYFLKQTFGIVRRKMIIGLFGFLIVMTGIFLTSSEVLEFIRSLPTSGFILFFTNISTIGGTVLIIYGFHGYSFFLEADWKSSLIALYIIDKSRTRAIYHKEFIKGDIQKEGVFAGGIAGIISVVREVLQSPQKEKKEMRAIDTINIGENLILLGSGEKAITALLVKKTVQHANFIIFEIIRRIETFFWDFFSISQISTNIEEDSELHEAIEIMIQDIIKFKW
ncbi:MAG: hypothetical protein ACTSRS_02210 [Candidatus Helarchaeota archaeon]